MTRASIDPELLLTHAPFLRSLARALRDDVTGADDLTQETWQRALVRTPRETADAPVRSWLARIMRSVRREAHRAAERRERREHAVATAEASRAHDPAPAIERLELLRQLATAVAELQEPYRGVILACYLDGLAPPELARQRGVPLATVHTQLRRAREQLRARLDPRDDAASRAALLTALGNLANGAATTAIAAPTWLSTRVVATLLFGVAAGIGVWWWSTGSRADDPSSRLVANRPEPTPASDEAPTSLALLSASREAATTAEPPDAEQLPVAAQVVLAESGLPVAGATVSFKELGATALAREQFTFQLYGRQPTQLREDDDQRQRDYEEFLASAGGSFRELGTTDAEGVIALPPFEDAVVLVTQDARRLIQRISRGDALPIRLALERTGALTIRVVDRHGAPAANVSVLIEAKTTLSVQNLWRSHTGDDGQVEVPPRHFDRFRAELPGAEWAVTLGVAAADAARVAIDPAALPTEPVELQLPPCGRVRVELRDEHGHVATAPALVGLARVDRKHGANTSTVGMAWRRAVDGIAEFEQIALDLELVVLPVDKPRRHDAVRTEISGPKREHETAVVTAPLGPRLPLVRGRIVHADGRPVSGWLFLTRWSVASAPHTNRVVTDSDGRFEIALNRYDSERADTSRIPVDVGWLTLRPASVEQLDPALAEAAIVLPLDPPFLEPGVHDLGDLPLAIPQVVAAGRVVDGAGQPVGGVEVAALAYRDGNWMKVAGLDAKTTPDGRFVIVGRTNLSPLRCMIPSPGWQRAAPIEFMPGARDLVVVAEPVTTLTGRLLLDPGLPVDQIAVRPSESLQSLADVRELLRQGSAPVTVADDGRFRIVLLGEKKGELEVGLGNGIAGHFELEPLLQIDAVSSDEAGVADERLAAIDLRGRLRVITLTVCDRAGAPLPAANLEARAVANDGTLGPRRRLLTDRHGTVRLLAAAPSYALQITKDGYEPQSLPRVDADRTIELDRSP